MSTNQRAAWEIAWLKSPYTLVITFLLNFFFFRYILPLSTWLSGRSLPRSCGFLQTQPMLEWRHLCIKFKTKLQMSLSGQLLWQSLWALHSWLQRIFIRFNATIGLQCKWHFRHLYHISSTSASCLQFRYRCWRKIRLSGIGTQWWKTQIFLGRC